MGESPFKDVPIDVFMERLRVGYHPEQPLNCPHEVFQVMFDCWGLYPNERPVWADLVHRMHNLCASKYFY